jgi:ABC-2 type transport system permease protein
MTGSIYDLGYRRYDGPRLGRRHAVTSLVRHSLRSVLGLGRGGRAKVLPMLCIGMPAVIAVLLVGIRALAARGGIDSSDIVPGHEGIFPTIWVFPVLFVAAQAPELLGRDQRYKVLTLYFARALRRPDYALGKLVALSLGVLAIMLVPHLVLGIGSILLTTDTTDAIGAELRVLPAVLGSSVVIAVVASALALAISSLTPRRAYATAAIFGAFIIPGIVAAIVIGLDLGTASQWIVLLDVGALLDGANAWFFQVDPSTAAALSGISTGILLGGALLVGVVSVIALVARYQRISA